MELKSVFCMRCGDLLYSKGNGDAKSCECGNVKIIGDESERVFFDDIDDVEFMLIDGDVLLEQILWYDFKLGNKNIPEEFKNGWHGKFKIRNGINMAFYEKLVGIEKAEAFKTYLCEKELTKEED